MTPTRWLVLRAVDSIALVLGKALIHYWPSVPPQRAAEVAASIPVQRGAIVAVCAETLADVDPDALEAALAAAGIAQIEAWLAGGATW